MCETVYPLIPSYGPSLYSFTDSCDEVDGDVKLIDINEKDEAGKNVLCIAIENGSPIDLIKDLLDRYRVHIAKLIHNLV